MSAAAEQIANTVARFKKGLIDTRHADMNRELMRRMRTAPLVTGQVVDVTSIYLDWIDGDNAEPFYPLDAIMLPPYEESVFCYVVPNRLFDTPNPRDNIVMIGSSVYERGAAPRRSINSDGSEIVDQTFEDIDKWERDPRLEDGGPDLSDDRGPIDWDKVRWIFATSMWIDRVGGPRVLGPIMAWRFAVRDDGTIEDLHYQAGVAGVDAHWFDNALTTYMKSVTWLSCRNVEVVTPKRSRPETRRLARFNVDVGEIHVRPIGKTYQYERGTKIGDGVPLHMVRGHIARYGIDGRKLLFGKYAGTFWVPSHVRGSSEHGERDPIRVLETQ